MLLSSFLCTFLVFYFSFIILFFFICLFVFSTKKKIYYFDVIIIIIYILFINVFVCSFIFVSIYSFFYKLIRNCVNISILHNELIIVSSQRR